MAEHTCKSTKEIKLNDSPTKPKLMLELQKRKWKSAKTETVLKRMREESFTSSKGARDGSVKFGIIIVDETLENPVAALDESEYFKEDMQLIVITVGSDVMADEDTLREMASSPSHYFHVNNYVTLQSLNHKIEELFCNGKSID